ncbi:hypothetical protein [Zhouia amylolytica]|nr:hypothetical protein [Zhouia amylolytica]
MSIINEYVAKAISGIEKRVLRVYRQMKLKLRRKHKSVSQI